MLSWNIGTKPALDLFIAAITLTLTLVGCGGGGGGAPTTAVTSVPSKPGSLTITPVSAQLAISWSTVSTATSYNLYWSTTPGVSKANGTKITSVASPYVQSALVNGTPYYYVLTAVNSIGESVESAQATGTPTPPPPGWSSANEVSTATSFLNTTIYPGAANVNNNGAAAASWSEEGNTSGVSWLYANIYQGGVWRTPTQIGAKGSSHPSVSVTASGDVIAVYEQRIADSLGNFVSTAIYSRRYNHLTSTWSTAEQISVNTLPNKYALQPYVVADSNGNAMAVWSEEQTQVFARRFDATLGAWESTATLLSNSPRLVYNPKVVVDGNNIYTAVWIQDTAAYNGSLPGGGANKPTPTARRYVSGSWGTGNQRIGWSTTDLPYGDFDSASRCWVEVNAAGNVFVVWEQRRTLADLSLQLSVDNARFDPVAGTWSAPSSIATHTAYLSWPQVAVDSTGNALVVWTKSDTLSSSIINIQSSRFSKTANTWSTPLLIDQTGTSAVSDVVMAMDSSGNAEVVWWEPGSLFPKMVERRYDATGGTGWGAYNSQPTPVSRGLLFDMSDAGYGILLGQSMDISASPFTVGAWSWILTP